MKTRKLTKREEGALMALIDSVSEVVGYNPKSAYKKDVLIIRKLLFQNRIRIKNGTNSEN